jgi:hypothetical protein
LEESGRSPALANALKRFPDAAGRLPLLLHPLAAALALARQTGRITAWARRRDD